MAMSLQVLHTWDTTTGVRLGWTRPMGGLLGAGTHASLRIVCNISTGREGKVICSNCLELDQGMCTYTEKMANIREALSWLAVESWPGPLTLTNTNVAVRSSHVAYQIGDKIVRCILDLLSVPQVYLVLWCCRFMYNQEDSPKSVQMISILAIRTQAAWVRY